MRFEIGSLQIPIRQWYRKLWLWIDLYRPACAIQNHQVTTDLSAAGLSECESSADSYCHQVQRINHLDVVVIHRSIFFDLDVRFRSNRIIRLIQVSSYPLA